MDSPEPLYRPTVRMDAVFQTYVNSLYGTTTLDRNQIIRLMMFAAPFSAMFQGTIRDNLKPRFDVPPLTLWGRNDSDLWREQSAPRSGRADVNADIKILIGGKSNV